MTLENEPLAGKVVLEVGSGRGDTTRRLVDLLEGQPGARLVVTDVSDRFFQHLCDEFQSRDLPIHFIQTGAQDLHGIIDLSVDYLVCNYTLCAVHSQSGQLMLSLRRFWQVLKAGGKLFVEEEFPITIAELPAQQIWAEKWRILKAATILAGGHSYNEIDAETLKDLCQLAGFANVSWTAHTTTYPEAGVLDFFQKRLDALLAGLSNASLRAGFVESAAALRQKFLHTGAMQVPFYRLCADKPSGN